MLQDFTTTSTTNTKLSDSTTSLLSFLSELATVIGLPVAIASLAITVMAYRSQQELSRNSLKQPVYRGELEVLKKLMNLPILSLQSISKIFPYSVPIESIKQKLLNTQKSLDQKLNILQKRCHSSKIAGEWLLQNQKNLSIEASEKVLGIYPNLKTKRYDTNRYSEKEFSLFSRHLENYLFLIGKCLNNCRPNAIEKAPRSEFLPILDDLYVEDYEKALRHILDSIAVNSLPTESLEELELYITFLVNRMKGKLS